MASTQPTRGTPADGVHLVNLTEHEIALQAHPSSAAGEGAESANAPIAVPATSQVARVDDSGARLGSGWLNVPAGRVPLTRLRRSRRLTGLPAPEPATRYLVSRLTAHAARRRTDLVFPLGDIRNGRGRITGAEGLGSYRPSPALVQRCREWRTGLEVRRSQRSLPAQWPTGVLFATGTALLSGALGLIPGVLDDIVTSGWAARGQRWTTWLTVAFLVAGTVVLAVAVRRWLAFMRKRGERGTAYVIEEQAIHWLHEEKAAVLARIAEEFASVLRVPGAEALGARWRWQADAAGAPHWDARTGQLVHSFWAVHYNEDHVTSNAVFVWAPWPVAMAFGARATARRRGLVLHVRQRPSYGAAGRRPALRLEDGAHDFLRGRRHEPLAASAPRHRLATPAASLTVTVRSLGLPAADPSPPGHRRAGPGARDARLAGRGPGARPGLLLLLVRFVRQVIGPIPAGLEQAEEVALHVSADLAGPVFPMGTWDVPAAEWRLTADDGTEVPWAAFPAVAETLADWVEQQAAAHPGAVILLAGRMPQEIAVGLGIQLGQRPGSWPSRLFPVHHTGECLTVPHLDLGRGSVPAEPR